MRTLRTRTVGSAGVDVGDGNDRGGKLPGRDVVLDRLGAMVASSTPSPASGAVVVVAVDDHGRLVAQDADGADEVLYEVSRRLDRLVRADDLLARDGDDRFVIVAPGLTPEVTGSLMDRIAGSVAMPLDFDGSSVSLGATVGVAFVDGHHADGAALLAAAEQDVERIRSRRG